MRLSNISRILALTLLATAWVAGVGCSDTVENRLEKAKIYLEAKDPQAALEQVDKALAMQPKNQEAMLLRARVLKSTSRFDEANNALNELLNLSDSEEPRREKLSLIFLQADGLMTAGSFGVDEKQNQDFENLLDNAKSQAVWLKDHKQLTVESEHNLGKVAQYRARLYQRKVELLKKLPTTTDTAKQEQIARDMEEYRKKVEAQLDIAESAFSNAVANDPRFSDSLAKLGGILRQRGEWRQLNELTTRMLSVSSLPADGVEELTLGIMNLGEGRMALDEQSRICEALMQKVDEGSRKGIAWKLSQARLYSKNRDFKRAIPIWDDIRKSPSADVKTRKLAEFWMGVCYYQLRDVEKGNLDKAESYLKVLANPSETSWPEPFIFLCYVLREKGKLSEARDQAQIASKLIEEQKLPQNYELLYTLIDLKATTSGDIRTAEKEVRDVYNSNRTDPRAVRLMVDYLLATAKRQEAEAVAKGAESIKPMTVQMHRALVESYAKFGDLSQALQHARAAADDPEGTTDDKLKVAQLMLASGEPADKIRPILEELKKANPKLADIDITMADTYSQSQQHDRARELLEQLHKEHPENVEISLKLGSAYMSLALLQDAINVAKEVLEVDPNNQKAHSLAYWAYQLSNQLELAQEHEKQIDVSQVDERENPAMKAQLLFNEGSVQSLDKAAMVCNRALTRGTSGENTLWLRVTLARIYMKQNRNEQALNELKTLVMQYPDLPNTYNIFVTFFATQGLYDKGVQELKSLQKHNEMLSRQAQASLLVQKESQKESPNYDEAIKTIQELLPSLVRDKNRGAMLIASTMCRIYLLKKDPKAAADVYDALIANNMMVEQCKMYKIDVAITTLPKDRASESFKAEVGKLTGQLVDIYQTLGKDQSTLRLEVIRRLRLLRQYDQAMTCLLEWQKLLPDQPLLLLWKGDLEQEMGKPSKAAETYRELIEKAPDRALLYLKLVQAYDRASNYPGVEGALESMAKLDTAARLEALAQLGEMYVNLGLLDQAQAQLQRLESAGKTDDPRVLFIMGRGYEVLNQPEKAYEKYSQVKHYAARQYVASQLGMVRIEMSGGKLKEARNRMDDLARDPSVSRLATAELIQGAALRLPDAGDLVSITDSGGALDRSRLGDQLNQQWSWSVCRAADARKEWTTVLNELTRFQIDQKKKGEKPDLLMSAHRAILQMEVGTAENARLAYHENSALRTDNMGPMTAVAIGEKPEQVTTLEPIQVFAVAAATGDQAGALEAVKKLPVMNTTFQSDLKDYADTASNFRSSDAAEAARWYCAAAMVLAYPNLSMRFCEKSIKALPTNAPAYSLMVQNLIDMGEGSGPRMVELVARINKALPGSALALWTSAEQKAAKNDYNAAVVDLEKLIGREKDHFMVQSKLASFIQYTSQPDRYDRAITWLKELCGSAKGMAFVQAANDLAYLLAEQKANDPKELKLAQELASKAYQQSGGAAAIADTLGWVEFKSGNPQRAQELLSRAVFAMRNNREVHYHMGVVYQAMGNKTWARYHLTEAAKDRNNKAKADLSYVKDAQARLNQL